MDITTIIGIVTFVVTYVMGILSKKSTFINNNIIPLQNLLIGIIAVVVNYFITKDFNLSLGAVGLFTGGTYDLVKNLNSLKGE